VYRREVKNLRKRSGRNGESYQIRVNYPLFGGDKAEGKGQTGALVRTEERKDFRQKGGYQGGFGIRNFNVIKANLSTQK